MEKIVILVTAGSTQEAEGIASVLLKERVVACVNIIDQVQSLFWWEGKIDRAQEVLLVVKTRKPFLERIIELVRENHSYDVPEVIALPIIGGNPAYLEWMDSVLK